MGNSWVLYVLPMPSVLCDGRYESVTLEEMPIRLSAAFGAKKNLAAPRANFEFDWRLRLRMLIKMPLSTAQGLYTERNLYNTKLSNIVK